MANSWLRLWHDMPNDPKWRTIARVSGCSISEVIAVYIHILVDASTAVKRGETHCNAEDVSSALDLEIDKIESILEAMQGRVLDGDRVAGWEQRQPQREDNSTDRVQKWREKRSVTQRNAVKRDVTLDKDKDTDKDKNLKPSRDKREPDPRFSEFKQACESYYRHKQVPMSWDGGESKQLSSLLAANPTLRLEQFQGILRNRSRSQVNHAERPRKWLSNATEYIAGPVDRFNKPQEAGNAGRTFTGTRSKSGQVIDDLRRSLEEDGYSLGIGEVGDSPAIEPWQGNDGSLRGRPGGDEPGGRSLGAGITLLPPAG